ncbi:MAG: cytochrome c [Planctomycetota bacterium]
MAKSRTTPTELAADGVSSVVDATFGTPESPRWPDELTELGLLDPEQLTRAAGAVRSDDDDQHFGLYNEHCVNCHGVSGGGGGPASQLQNPYPRDFRAGVFKWKSTERASKPTRADLNATIRHGVPGSGMPSFSQLSEDDADALVDFVIYLSVRGEFERRLLAAAIDELDYGESLPDPLARLSGPSMGSDALELSQQILRETGQRWVDARDEVIVVEAETANDADSIERGKVFFHGQIANCVGCHGEGGNAESVTTLDYDDWTKEYTTRLGITPSDRDAVKPFRDAGAPRPRQIHPRTLTSGVFRGGGNAETLYRRLAAGIAGTPMPAVVIRDQSSAIGLTPSQVWDMVHYVQSLGADERD